MMIESRCDRSILEMIENKCDRPIGEMIENRCDRSLELRTGDHFTDNGKIEWREITV